MSKILQSLCLFLIAASGNLYAQTFTSSPVTVGTANVPYTYSITATEASNNPITFTAPTLPSWLTFSATGQNTYSTFGGSIFRPIGVTADNAGNTYATTYSSGTPTDIYKILPDGTTIPWATRQAGNPYSMATHNGYLYLSYYSAATVSKITKIDLNNPAAGETTVVNFPSNYMCIGITFYQGDLYAAMYSNRSIVKVNLSNGTYTNFVTNLSSHPWGLGFTNNGDLYIATYGGASIQKYSGGVLTTVLSNIGTAADIKIDNNGYFYLSSASGGIRKYNPTLTSFVQVVPATAGPVYGQTLTSNGTLVFSLFNQNICARIQTGAVLTGTPSISHIGVHNVSINATNGSTTANQNFAITVTGPSTFTLPNITKNYGDSSFTITSPSSTSNGAFSYISSNPAVATISGNTVNIIGKGTSTITATQAASGLYLSTNKTFTITVNAIAPTISGFANITKTFGNPSFALNPPTSNSGGAFSYTSSNPAVATISGNTITLNGIGTSTITANQAAADNYTAGSISSTLTVNSNLQGPANITSGISMWLDASDVNADGSSLNNGNLFNIWKDKSGNAHNAVKHGSNNGVTFVTNQINGKPVVRFTRVNDNLGSVLEATGVDVRAGANPDVTMFTVYKPGTRNETSGQGQALWGNDNGAWDRFFYNSWSHTDDGIASLGTVNPTFISVAGAGVPNSLRLMTAVFDGTVTGTSNSGPALGSAIYFDGKVVTKFTDNTDPFQAQTTLRIGNDGDNGSFNGDVAEMIVYNRKLTDCEIQTINQYLSAKYAVSFTTASITPSGSTSICNGGSITLTASAGTAYQWYLNGSPINGATSATYTAALAGNYTVTITSAGGCSSTSAEKQISIYPPVNGVASNNGPVTAGGTINLNATGGTSYAWTGPNGFTSNAQNPIIANATSANQGTYTVTITQNDCTNTASTNVVVLSTPARALSFGGSNDYVNLGSLLPSNASFTKEAWILSTDANSANNIFSTNADPIWIPNGTLSVGQAGNYQVITDTNPFALNTWTHVAVTYDQPAKALKLYVNGILKASTLNAPAYAGGTIFLGHHAGGSGNSSIKMDEVRFWNRALCQGEIQNNMNAELDSASQSGLIALYHANQGFVNANNSAETTLSDASGNNKNGTLANFVLTGSSSNWTEGPVTGTAPVFVPPTASFTANGPLTFCPSGLVTLTANTGSGFTYQWTKNGLPIEGANAVSYTANASGSYNVIITQSGCTASAEAMQVVVEDLIAPTVSKLQDAIVDLDNNCSFILPDYRSQLLIGDNCTPKTSLIVTQTPAPGTELTGAESISVSFSVKDLSGNDTTSSFTLVKRDVTAPTVAAKNYTLYLGANGAGTLTTSDVNNNSSDGCGAVALSFSNAGKICAIANENGTLSLTAPQGAVFTSIDFASYGNATGSCGNFVQGWCNSSLSQSRVEAAFLGKNSGSIVANNGNFGDPCYGTVKRLVVQASYSIPGVSINGESVSFTCNQVGNNTVTLIGSDASGNVANATAIVTVIDSVKPKALAQNIIVQLDASGRAFTTAEAVNNGSTDACGIASVTLSKTAFDCSNVGENTVVLTVIDVNGNVSTANATITVQDKITPLAIAQNVTIYLDATGNASTTADAVNNGSTDACGIASATLSKTAFNCSNVGENEVILTLTDVNGNVSTANAIVTVLDNVAPVALAQNVTVQLDASGNASITADAVNNGSTDACGIKSITLSKTDFDCSNVGENTVVLTVTDVNGNVSAANAIVTVQDNTAPAVITRNVVVQLNANGQGSITESQINNGSSDNCSIASYNLDKKSFDCSNVGLNGVVLTVTDVNGNVSTANATVTVEDNIAPLALAKNIQVTLVNGAASITAASIDNGSNDACGIQSLALDKASFDCSNLGQNTVVLTVTDKNGNVSSATAVVNVIGVTPIASIAVSRSNNTFTGLHSKTIALGYGAQSLTLTASNSTSTSNATTYAWHPSAGLSSANVASPVFTPTAAGTYTFNVIATNEFGCTASSSVTITVLDVRCGSKNEKVLVCQKTGSGSNPWVQICISPNAVDAHLKKGSTLGTCGTTGSTTLASSPENETLTLSNSLNVSNNNSLTVYPNPFVNETTVSFTLISDAAKVSLDLYDLKGVRISSIYSGKAEAFRNYSFQFDGKSIPAGVYFFRLSGSGNALNFKVIVSQ